MPIDLFQSEKGDELYQQLKTNNVTWHKWAREYWNNVYNYYNGYLDKDFCKKFPYETLSCLWELKCVSYLDGICRGKLESIAKGKITLPDFKWLLNGKSYYIEATSANKGSSDKYPYLNTPLSQSISLLARDGTKGHREYRERLTAAFREKAECKYDPTSCDLTICNHASKKGYKDSIEGNGYIIAISMAKIDFMNQPQNWQVDVSCFFPCSPYLTLAVEPSGKVYDAYHSYNPSFNKGLDESKKINVDIFANEKYSHVSAVLISRCWEVLFPNLSHYVPYLNFGVNDNDFILIHNPFASVPIEVGVLPVKRELIAEQKDGKFIIETIGTKDSVT